MALHWILPQAIQDVVRFTVAPTGNRIVTLSDFTTPFNCFVDWGDGAKSAQITSNTPVTHTYADTTPRQISIRGVLGGFWNTAATVTGKTLVTSLDEVYSRSLSNMMNTFRDCTSLGTLLNVFDAPNVSNFNFTFYGCKSIVSTLPPLWMVYPTVAHVNCFNDCFKSLYGQYGTACSNRQYVPAVSGQTYYQRYGQSGCPSSTYHAQTQETYYERHGGFANCPGKTSANINTHIPGRKCTSCNAYIGVRGSYYTCATRGTQINSTVTCSKCKKVYSVIDYTGGACRSKDVCLKKYTNSAYYSCSYFGGTCKGSGCSRTYSSGQSAYYKCARLNAVCPTATCPYPYVNEQSYNAARAAGWA